MPQNVTARVDLRLVLDEFAALGGLDQHFDLGEFLATAFGNGTGANAINRSWRKSATAAASTPDTWTLSGLVDDYSRTIPIAICRLVLIFNRGTTRLLVGGAAVDPWVAPFGGPTDRVVCPAAGWLGLCGPDAAGLGVTAGVSDQLKVDPETFSVDYLMIFLGE